MDLGLANKVALVTGGSKGIGRGVALGLAAEGAHVALCARGEKALHATAEEVRQHGVRALPLTADAAVAEDVERVIEETFREFDGVDILINNAGAAYLGRDHSLDDTAWQANIDLNFFSAIRFSRAVIPSMKERGGGRIINISSIYGHEPGAGVIDYNATKAAMLSLSKSLANELAPTGITVNAVCPGAIRTPGWERFAAAPSEQQGIDIEEFFHRFAQDNVAMGRFGTVDECAALVVFLASDRASYITGVCYNIDGGWTKSMV